jgi:phosphatidate cytidylyltransferase
VFFHAIITQNTAVYKMIQRFISGIVLAALVLAIVLLNNILLYILIALVAALMLHEWYNMTKTDERFMLLGLPIISIPLASILCISMMSEGTQVLVLFVTIIAFVDTFAMIGGKLIGGAKLAPKLSPNKTWSGLVVGATAGGAISFFLSFVLQWRVTPFEHWQFLVFGTTLGLVEQSSDLFISFFKRKFKLKDSGHIIPGHGGVLDRADGIIFTAPLFLYIFSRCVQN